VQVICCAVEGVDNPEMIRFTLATRFLRLNGVVRVVFVNNLDDGGFGGEIRRANEIVMAFLFNSQLVAFVENFFLERHRRGAPPLPLR